MTPREHDLLIWIGGFISEKGYSPSSEEMATAMGLASKSGVIRMIDSLEGQGFVRRRAHAQRSIEVVSSPVDAALLRHRLLARLRATGHVVDDGEGDIIVATLDEFETILREVLG